jgi:hypothetical protein
MPISPFRTRCIVKLPKRQFSMKISMSARGGKMVVLQCGGIECLMLYRATIEEAEA